MPECKSEFILFNFSVISQTTLNVQETDALAIIKAISMSTDLSWGIHGVTIVEIAVKRSETKSNFLRSIRFNSGMAMKMPGISKATTTMKLVYRLNPGMLKALKLNP